MVAVAEWGYNWCAVPGSSISHWLCDQGVRAGHTSAPCTCDACDWLLTPDCTDLVGPD